MICQNAQGSGDLSGGNYAEWVSEATKWVDAFDGGGLSASDASSIRSVDVERRYSFEVEANETYWDALQRLAKEVNWRCFESAGIIYFVAEPTLMQSEIRMRVSDDAPGIDDISWDLDFGKKVTEITVTGRAKAWAAPPGSVAIVSGEGPADGRYLVSTINSNLHDTAVDVTLKRPTQPLPEPAPETETRTIGGKDPTDSATGAGGGGASGGSVKLAPGADRAGVATKQAVLEAVRSISAVFGEPLTITTGTNHSQFTTSGSVSQHWTGDAADIAMLGDRLTRLGQSALIAGGMPESSAKRETGGLYNLANGWQVIFNTNEGGNHYNHLHVGI